MKNSYSALALFIFSLLPYSAVSWGYMKLVDGGSTEFWYAFAGLMLARLFFSVIETLGSVVTWHAYSRKLATTHFLEVLKASKYSSTTPEAENLELFLADVIENEEAAFSERISAKEFQVFIKVFPMLGLLPGMRLQSAAQEAYSQYKKWGRFHAS